MMLARRSIALFDTMPRWIIPPNGVVVHPRIAIPRLHTLGLLRDNCVSLDEAPQPAVVPPGPIVVQPYFRLVALTGVLKGGCHRPVSVACLSPATVAQLCLRHPIRVNHAVGAAQVIAQQEVQPRRLLRTAAAAHCHPHCPGIIVLHQRARAAHPFEIVGDINSRHAPRRALHPHTAAIINKRRAGCPAHPAHLVLGVVRQRVALPRHRALDHVAVQVVAVAFDPAVTTACALLKAPSGQVPLCAP